MATEDVTMGGYGEWCGVEVVSTDALCDGWMDEWRGNDKHRRERKKKEKEEKKAALIYTDGPAMTQSRFLVLLHAPERVHA